MTTESSSSSAKAAAGASSAGAGATSMSKNTIPSSESIGNTSQRAAANNNVTSFHDEKKEGDVREIDLQTATTTTTTTTSEMTTKGGSVGVVNPTVERNDDGCRDDDDDDDDDDGTDRVGGSVVCKDDGDDKVDDKVDDVYRPWTKPLFIPTHQMQRWGDDQHSPHTDWGDIFFDLFYVAAAYNLGSLLKDEPTSRGLLYLAGCFLSVQDLWMFKVYFDSRFVTSSEDVFHHVYEIAVYIALATAVLHIRPVSILSDPRHNADMFLFSLSAVIARVLGTGRLLEVMITQRRRERGEAEHHDGPKKLDDQDDDDEEEEEGDSAEDHHHDDAKNDDDGADHHHRRHGGHGASPIGLYPEAYMSALRDIYTNLPSLALHVAAAAYSGREYYSNGDDGDGGASTYDGGSHGYDEGGGGDDGDGYHNDTAKDGDHRFFRSLAGGGDDDDKSNDDYDDVAIYLCLSGSISTLAMFFWFFIIFFGRPGIDHKKYTVPANIDYLIHRYGEWTMLMLGESVLSLLIVALDNGGGYYTTFFSGVVSIVLLEFLHFRSQPHDPDEHALRRTKLSGLAFSVTMQVYSCALVVLGTSYKMFLYEFLYASDEEKQSGGYGDEDTYDSSANDTAGYGYGGGTGGGRSVLSLASSSSSSPAAKALLSRWLAGGDALRFETDDRQQRIAHFFAGSMALVFLCMDCMILSHHGVRPLLDRLRNHRSRWASPVAVALVSSRAIVIVLFAAMSQFATDPQTLAFVGLCGVVAQLFLRSVGDFFYVDELEREVEAIERMAEYANARIRNPK